MDIIWGYNLPNVPTVDKKKNSRSVRRIFNNVDYRLNQKKKKQKKSGIESIYQDDRRA